MKIAVVGAGLSGLAAAWLLARHHEVTLYERQARPGFTAASVLVPAPGGLAAAVDVPLRVFYPGYYPTLTRLYDALGVASEPVNYASSLAGADGRLYFRYRNLRWGDRSWGVLAPADLLLGHTARRILGGLLHFHRDARRVLHGAGPGDDPLRGLSIGDFVHRHGHAREFVEGFLLPAIATVCTCSHRQASDFPAAVIVDYLARGLVRDSVRRAVHGAHDVQARLLAGIPQLVCDARIEAIRRLPPDPPRAPGERSDDADNGDHDDNGGSTGVALHMADGCVARFDHVVLATQANHARRLLADARADEAAVLAGFHYTPVEVLTHRDASLLPTRRGDWSPVNLRVTPDQDAPQATIWINAVQPALRGAPDLFQTVTPHQAPRPGTLLGQARFERPVVSASSQQALAGLLQLHGQAGRRVWFCGSYAQAGIPLLESAVRSAHDVAARLGAPLPAAASA